VIFRHQSIPIHFPAILTLLPSVSPPDHGEKSLKRFQGKALENLETTAQAINKNLCDNREYCLSLWPVATLYRWNGNVTLMDPHAMTISHLKHSIQALSPTSTCKKTIDQTKSDYGTIPNHHCLSTPSPWLPSMTPSTAATVASGNFRANSKQ
jgi:uncharacterized protein involved in tolerance to divalent cations